MGMSCDIRALTQGQIEVLLENPDRVWDIVFNENDVFNVGGADEGGREPLSTLLKEPLREELTLDKSWDILRFLLCKAGGRSPESHHERDSFCELLWGDLVGDHPADYYGPLLRSVQETVEFAAFLEPLTADQLLSHFDWQEMREAQVYLIWDDDPTDALERDQREYASQYFGYLREYVLKAAASKCGLLLTVN